MKIIGVSGRLSDFLKSSVGGEGDRQAYLKDKVNLPPQGHNPPFDPPFGGRLDDLR